MTAPHWPKFLQDVLDNAPRPMRYEGVQANIHPDESGQWVWHASIIQDDANPQKQREWLESFMGQIGKGSVKVYKGGVVKRLLHATKPLTKREVQQLPADTLNLLRSFEPTKGAN